MASRMTIRCGALHTLRHRCFLFSSSLLLLCLLKLVYINVRVKNSFYLEPYGFTASYFRTWAHGHNINCTRIYKLEPVEIGKSLELRRKANVVLEDDRIVSLSADCERLNADLNCISDMLKSDVKWEYVINLCGQDFPLKTNYELVMELKALNGSNMLESSRPSELKKQRFVFQYELQNMPYEYHKLPVKTTRLKDAAPHNIQVFIGSAYFVLSRDFVTFVTTSPVAKDFLAWSADTYSPDEHFWATLVRVPGVPGHILRTHIDITDLQSKTRAQAGPDLARCNPGVCYPTSVPDVSRHVEGHHGPGLGNTGPDPIGWASTLHRDCEPHLFRSIKNLLCQIHCTGDICAITS
ncbi:unnamed protein product [Gadus morhua 'NCC']